MEKSKKTKTIQEGLQKDFLNNQTISDYYLNNNYYVVYTPS